MNNKIDLLLNVVVGNVYNYYSLLQTLPIIKMLKRSWVILSKQRYSGSKTKSDIYRFNLFKPDLFVIY